MFQFFFSVFRCKTPNKYIVYQRCICMGFFDDIHLKDHQRIISNKNNDFHSIIVILNFSINTCLFLNTVSQKVYQ